MTIENEGLRGLGNIIADAAGGKSVRGRTGSAVRQRSGVPEETGTFRRLAPVGNRIGDEDTARTLLAALKEGVVADPLGNLALQADGLDAGSVTALSW